MHCIGIVGAGAMRRGIAQVAAQAGDPQWPLALGDTLGTHAILEVPQNLTTRYGDPRYRPSPWLLRRARLGRSLLAPDARLPNAHPRPSP